VKEVSYSSVSSPIGTIWVARDRIGVCLLRLGTGEDEFLREIRAPANRKPNREVEEEISAYFAGKITRFSTPLHSQGTPFDMNVWEALLRIPLGETRSYQEVAREVGNPKGCRAVGGANRRNPIPLLIPCHRVIRKDGGLGGFACGQEIKAWLLRFEQRVSHG
jgi:O-6-methylguanine DNA methyltransferase